MTRCIDDIQREIVQEFAFFDDWMDRYQYLIDLGRQLPSMAVEDTVEANLLHGCQSQVWFIANGSNETLEFRASSDSAIVSGLIALLLRIYSGQSADNILGAKPFFIEEIGLSKHLSPTRSNGLHAMLQKIYREARATLQ